MGQVLQKQDIKINKLLSNWNMAAQKLSTARRGSDFVHYYGEEGKRELIELYEKKTE